MNDHAAIDRYDTVLDESHERERDSDGWVRGGALATIPPEEVEEALVFVEREREQALPGLTLAGWYVDTLNSLDETEARIKEAYAAMLRALDNRRKAMAWKFGAQVKLETDAMISAINGSKGKAKSVMLPTGRAGYRQQKETIRVTKSDALRDWCVDHCPLALNTVVARKTPIHEHIRRTGEIPPGVEVAPAQDRFYPEINPLAFGPAAWQPAFEDNEKAVSDGE